VASCVGVLANPAPDCPPEGHVHAGYSYGAPAVKLAVQPAVSSYSVGPAISAYSAGPSYSSYSAGPAISAYSSGPAYSSYVSSPSITYAAKPAVSLGYESYSPAAKVSASVWFSSVS
jgi:hypothetical protein